ncbi:hypothetical protein T439DRAFT_343373 [Meredithblackwellia eburnea MCA 4105]
MALWFLGDKPDLVRPKIEEGRWSFFGGDLQTWYVSGDEKHFTSGQLFKAGSPHTGVGRKSTATPPYHRHTYQTETFSVKKGRLCYVVNGRLGKLEAGQSYTSKAGEWHTFYSDPDLGEDMEVHITVRGGENPGFDENFVHNFYGYLSSKVMAGKRPSMIQVLCFQWYADVILENTPLGLGKIGLGWWANLIFGKIIGEMLLGYKHQYKEFDD